MEGYEIGGSVRVKRGFGRDEGKFFGGFVRGKGKKLYLCTELS